MSRDNAHFVSRSEFMQAIEVKDIVAVINAEHELCKGCKRFQTCDRFSCDHIRYAVTNKEKK